MSIRKGILAILLMTTLLCLLLPTPATADYLGTWTVIAITGALILIFGIYKVMEWDNYFDINPGDIFVNVRSNSLPVATLNPVQATQAHLGQNMEFDLDWLLTERIEGKPWVGTGITIEFMPGPGGFSKDEIRYGHNFTFGYREGQWDHKLFMLYFPDEEFRMNVDMVYRF